MSEKSEGNFWVRVGLIVVAIPLCFVFPYALLVVLILAWAMLNDYWTPKVVGVPPRRTWLNVTAEDSDWLEIFCEGCESPAESQFLVAMVKEFKLYPKQGALVSPQLSMEMQVEHQRYRYDFVVNKKFIIEIDGATYHSSPEAVERDRVRDEFSVDNGFNVLRIPASVVFRNPSEAIRLVKDFVFKTAVEATALVAKAAAPHKPVKHYLNGFSKLAAGFAQGCSDVIQHIEEASLKQSTTAEFRTAISTEQIRLEGMVRSVEIELQVLNLSPDARRHHDEMYAALIKGNSKLACAEDLPWSLIVFPAPVDNKVIQEQIQRECTEAMDDRTSRFFEIWERCVQEPEFAKLFRKKMVASGFSDMKLIFPGVSPFTFQPVFNKEQPHGYL